MGAARMSLIAGIGLALTLSAPAAALTGWGVASALRTAKPVTISAARAKGSGTQTCQVQRRDRKAKSPKLAVVGDARSYAVVACEQPPRSQVITPTLKQATASALAALG
jgi:hypothetical protein